MSFELTKTAWEARRGDMRYDNWRPDPKCKLSRDRQSKIRALSLGEFLVLLFFCDVVPDKDCERGNEWEGWKRFHKVISYRRIGDKTGSSRRLAMNAVASLVAAGLIRVHMREDWGLHKANEFEVTF